MTTATHIPEAKGLTAVDPASALLPDRRYWLSVLTRLADPVLGALASRRLRIEMPVESKFGDLDRADRESCTHLEALGRLLMGIAPWLEAQAEDPEEEELRSRYASIAREALDSATDPLSPDRMNFGTYQPGMIDHGRNQSLVDTALLAQAMLRAPNELWHKLTSRVKACLVDELKESRQIKPAHCNWLLFSAAVEAALAMCGEEWDPMRVDYAVRQHEAWHVGDGAYRDGPNFHWDYYNSYVIQPMLLDILPVVDPGDTGRFGLTFRTTLARARRYAAVLERSISPEGAIPPIGRSITYRMGALQLLGQIALLRELPEAISPEQVRCGMTLAMQRLMEAPGTFDKSGWLRIGFCGSQPGLGEPYISTGSLYFCAAGLLPLGLPSSDPFWSGPSRPWSAKSIYASVDMPADHSL